ncbi:tetratricopeptide repeat protein [Desulfitobacterium sp. AusDCA]|uniref:tetratricopeptide repeat protein n=1 Tax=Desulfitobacterium sp. AusDCA TaxID=3240383 RepID=UPI003DA770C4
MDLTVKKKLLLSFLGIALILGIWSIDRYGKGMDSNSVSKLSAANMDQISSSSENAKAAILEKENQLKENPGDANLRLELGNQYYDLASELQSSNPEEAVLDFNKAVTHYQEYLKTNNVLRVWVDLATAAYYGNDEATAENAFKKAIQIDSKDDQVHYKYGVFLFHSKKDYPGAVQEWKTALALNPSGQDAERIKRLISGLEAEIAAGQEK